jgi:hypothetical protein
MGNYGRQWDRVALLGLIKSFQNGNPPLSGALEYRQVADPTASQSGTGMGQNYVRFLFFYCKIMASVFS